MVLSYMWRDKMAELIIGVIILGTAFIVLLQKSNEELRNKKEEERKAIKEAREIPINPSDEWLQYTTNKPIKMDRQQNEIPVTDVKLLEYGRKAGLAIAEKLTSSLSMKKAIASEISIMFYILQDMYQAAKGFSQERRKSNLNIIFAIYWKSFNDAFNLTVEEAGRYFDERQMVFTKFVREKPGFSEKFLKESEDYLTELISWMLATNKPSNYIPTPSITRGYSPVCLDLLLKHKVHIAVNDVLTARISEFLVEVANSK